MRAIKCEGIMVDNGSKRKRECLLRQVNSVADSGSPRFAAGQLAWEASTLPLSYTRSCQQYYALALVPCQDFTQSSDAHLDLCYPYTMAMTGDSLSPSSITDNLGTRFIGQRVIYFRRTTSTNDKAKREAQRGAAEGTVFITEEQTRGKGRIKRLWLSPRGSIALSIILYPPVAHLPSLVMLASLAVVHCIKMLTGLESGVKWPNDVLINGKKVSGILIESDVRGDRVDHAVIGIGINVNLKLANFPEISPAATSLSDELGRDVSRLGMVRCLLTKVESLYLTLQAGDSIYQEWRDRLVTLGKPVRVTWGETVYEGIAESAASDGSLLLRQPDGNLIKIVAGDVVTLRH